MFFYRFGAGNAGLGAATVAAFTMVLLAMAALTAARALARVKRQAGQRILGYLAMSVRLNAPLPDMLEAAANAERGRVGQRLWNLAQRLRSGGSLRDALLHAAPEVTPRHRELIGVA